MLFNSYTFILVFLPITLIGYYSIAGKQNLNLSALWLVSASLFFYGWWNPVYLLLIVFSIGCNYLIGNFISTLDKGNLKKHSLIMGVLINLSLLGYYKYANFFVDNLNDVINTNFHLETIILPLAISFFTFQQIAYLVDVYKGDVREHGFLKYCLFVTFFPQLIAGPIVHHKEMMPQFLKNLGNKLSYKHLAVGLTIFSIGLFKKVVIADNVSLYVGPVFATAEVAGYISFFDAWRAALAYTLQMYFDFSGYSDMAIGLARMFAIRLPMNFYSPYKAKSIIDFWRLWHITLTRFLTTYVYLPISLPLTRYTMMNNFGKKIQFIHSIAIPVLITFLLSGLWHGAGWTFIAWGVLHGCYLVINNLWRQFYKSFFKNFKSVYFLSGFTSQLITFLAVVLSFVLFRAESIGGAIVILDAMFGGNGFLSQIGTSEGILALAAWSITSGTLLIIILIGLALFAPNTQQIMIRYQPVLEVNNNEIKPFKKNLFQWRPNYKWALFTLMILFISMLNLANVSEFLYYNF